MKTRSYKRPAFLVSALLLLGVSLACFVWVRKEQRQYMLNRQLIEALKRNDTNEALTLVNAGATILFLPPQIPDLLKASEQRLRLVEALLAKGAQVNIRGSQGITPLMIAAINCDTEMLEILLRHGARVNDRDIDGSTGLIWAVTRRFPNELTAKGS